MLKGALLFRLWFDLQKRPTRDADFLGFGDAEPAECAAVFREIVSVAEGHELDGVIFEPDSVRTEAICKEAGYPDVRITFFGDVGRCAHCHPV